MAQEPAYRLTERKGSLEIEIELPLVESAAAIDAYAECQQLEVAVEGLYFLRLPLNTQVKEDDLCCKWSKKTRTLTITLPTTPDPAPVPTTPDPAPEEELHRPPEELLLADDLKEENLPELVVLEKQDVQRTVEPGAAPAKVSDETGVSDFSIFKHDLQQELDAIYDATRAKLPTIADDEEDSDDDEAVVPVNVSAQLAALSRRTYESLREVGFECPMTEDGLVDVERMPQSM